MPFQSVVMTPRRADNKKPRRTQPKPRFIPQLENLEERVLLHGGPGLIAEINEHSMVFGGADSSGVVHPGLVPLSAVTDTALASGTWLGNQAAADPTQPVWSNGVPKPGDNVYIPAGVTVTLDGLEGGLDAVGNPVGTPLRTIRVDGTLNFEADQNTSLLVDTIIVMPTGVFQMGTQQAPIQFDKQAQIVFAMYSSPNRDQSGPPSVQPRPRHARRGAHQWPKAGQRQRRQAHPDRRPRHNELGARLQRFPARFDNA